IIITGANSGLGYEAARHFAMREPGKLILVCRDEKKGQQVVDRLKEETKFSNIELWSMDLPSFDSVKAIKEKLDNLERLDILIENAAVATLKYELTPDDCLQVNLISTALHIVLHIPKMLRTARKYRELTPRIVVVSTDSHYWSTIHTEAIDAPNSLEFLNQKKYAMELLKSLQRYPETKLLATFLPRMFQSHLPPSSEPTITCVNVNPGFCQSELMREVTNGNAPQEMVERIRKAREQLAFSSEEGSRQLLYAAIGQRDKEEELRGGLVAFNKVTECSDWILSVDGQRFEKKLWGELLEVIGKADETAKEIIKQDLS
ncbi:NAD(P)-binding protein, partial [Marasmius fiardii PR-910]